MAGKLEGDRTPGRERRFRSWARRFRRALPGFSLLIAGVFAGLWLESWIGSSQLSAAMARPQSVRIFGAGALALFATGLFRLVDGPLRVSVGPVRFARSASALFLWATCTAALTLLHALL